MEIKDWYSSLWLQKLQYLVLIDNSQSTKSFHDLTYTWLHENIFKDSFYVNYNPIFITSKFDFGRKFNIRPVTFFQNKS